MIKLFSFLMVLAFSTAGYASAYEIDYAKSSITFSGEHAGNAFEGNFKEWDAEIIFDPNNLEQSSLSASFKTTSAETGNAMYDGTLPQADWFAAKEHPQAHYQSRKITALEEANRYHAEGDLTLRGVKQPVAFDFTLTPNEDGTRTAKADFTIDRISYEIGKKSDAQAEWVSRGIGLSLEIIATPQ
jgi:cytochrome b561